MSRANRLAELRKYDEQNIQRHYADAVDSSWENITTPSLRTHLEHIAKEGTYRVADVNCRSTSCVATFEWPTRADAMREYAAIIHQQFDVNCSRGITLPETGDPSQPLQATMFLDCAQWKKGGSVFASVSRQ